MRDVSSRVASQAHNLEVEGSNPSPAIKRRSSGVEQSIGMIPGTDEDLSRVQFPSSLIEVRTEPARNTGAFRGRRIKPPDPW